MTGRAVFRLVHDRARSLAVDAVTRAEDGAIVTVGAPTRNLEQNARLHAMLSDIVKAGTLWDSSTHDIEFWKSLVVSGWAIATKAQGRSHQGHRGRDRADPALYHHHDQGGNDEPHRLPRRLPRYARHPEARAMTERPNLFERIYGALREALCDSHHPCVCFRDSPSGITELEGEFDLRFVAERIAAEIKDG